MSSEYNNCDNKLNSNGTSSDDQDIKVKDWSDENSSLSSYGSNCIKDDVFEYSDDSSKESCNSNNLKEKELFIKIDNWPLSLWPNGSRRSAFQPYKPITVLTNLQRGNTKTNTDLNDDIKITLHEQAGLGDLTVELIRDTENDLNKLDDHGLSALMWAAAYGQTSTISLLITNGAEVNHTSYSGETALLFAAAHGHLDVIKFLIQHDADVNQEDFRGNTALMYAAYGDHPHVINELLLHGATFSTTNNNGDTAYTIALARDSNVALTVLESHLVTLLMEEIS